VRLPLFRQVVFHLRVMSRSLFFLQNPILMCLVACVGALGAGRADAFRIGACASLWASASACAGIIGFQRYQGVLDHVRLSAGLPSLVLSLCIALTVLGCIGIPVAAVAALLGDVTPRFEDLIGIAAFGVASAAVAYVLASVFARSRHALQYEVMLSFPMWLFSGISIASDRHEDWWAIPIRYSPLAMGMAFPEATFAMRAVFAVEIVVLVAVGYLLAGLSERRLMTTGAM
jgi:ABC-2 type transport system permease protein